MLLSALRPRLSTVVIFLVMFVMWLPVVTDVFDIIEEVSDPLATTLLFVLVFAIFGLTGVYGAMHGGRLYSVIFVRSALLCGAAVGLAILLGELIVDLLGR